MAELSRVPIFRALTQPQMFAGVTYSFFIINGVVTTETFLITRSFWAFGVALAAIGANGRPLTEILERLSQVIFKIVAMVMRVAPIGAFGAMAFTVGAFGLQALLPMGRLMLDVYLPKIGDGPFPVILWYGGLWQPAKHAGNIDRFLSSGVAVVAVQSQTLTDAVEQKVVPPISVPMSDALRAVQFVRFHAPEWKLDPERIGVAGGSQGTLPALFVGCA